MIEHWLIAVPALLVSVVLFIVPGALLILAGWGHRRPTLFLLSPAASTAIIGVAALVAPLVGLPWSPLPVLLLTAIAAGIAFLVRRLAPPAADPHARATWIHALIALSIAGILALGAFALAFGSPENIAQRFDNIVHLNSVRFAIETANASPFNIGQTSDIGFYPSAWHAVTALAIQLTGASVPVAINAANLAIVALVWPASAMALAGVLFGGRKAALYGSAAMTTGFAAFPALFFNWGVLYPNVLGYATVAASLAGVALLLRAANPGERIRDALLLGVLATGTTLAHPNALLALVAFGGAYAVAILTQRVARARTRASITALVATILGVGVLAAALWAFARTPAEHSGWAPWQTVAQAAGEGVLFAPRGFPVTPLVILCLIAGLVAVARIPRHLPVVIPFLVAVTLFVVSSGFPIDHPVRQILTNPWYNDPNRLAALIPIAAIPVLTLGIVWLADVFPRQRLPRAARVAVTVLAIAVLFTVALGSNVRTALGQVREAYTATPEALLLSPDERALLERLPDEVAEDALIAGSPRTGTSLAFAIAGRDVVEKHVFGQLDSDERFLIGHLRDIETDPKVCEVVDRIGVDYVLDFGRLDILGNDQQAKGYDGIQDLTPSDHLVLVDSEGPDARLFRIEGC